VSIGVLTPQSAKIRIPSAKAEVMSFSEKAKYDKYFEGVLSEHHAMISRVVSTYEMKKALQEELYQEISVALWRALPKFDNQSSLKTYILSIAHKRSVSHVAKHVREPSSVDIAEHEFSGENCPSETIRSNQQMDRLMNALMHLPIIDRQLVTLALEGMSYKEISEILGISVSNVGVKLNRAKQKLNEMLSAEVKS